MGISKIQDIYRIYVLRKHKEEFAKFRLSTKGTQRNITQIWIFTKETPRGNSQFGLLLRKHKGNPQDLGFTKEP